MRRPGALVTLGFLLLVTALAGWRLAGSAERPPQLLTGELWQMMSHDAKVAFVWGIGNLVEFERAQGAVQSSGSKSFIPFLVKSLSGKPLSEVVRQVDLYYQAHPAEIKRPVVDAVFQAVVLPALRGEKGGNVK
jgi:hypothetical protein